MPRRATLCQTCDREACADKSPYVKHKTGKQAKTGHLDIKHVTGKHAQISYHTSQVKKRFEGKMSIIQQGVDRILWPCRTLSVYCSPTHRRACALYVALVLCKNFLTNAVLFLGCCTNLDWLTHTHTQYGLAVDKLGMLGPC